jgi:hypothetical protein
VITTFKFSDQLLVAFATSALFIVGLSVLFYARRVILQSLAESWGHLVPTRRATSWPERTQQSLEVHEENQLRDSSHRREGPPESRHH